LAAAGWVSGGLGDAGCCGGASAAGVGAGGVDVGGVADCGRAGGGNTVGAAGGGVGLGAAVDGVGIGGGTLDSERGRTAGGAEGPPLRESPAGLLGTVP
jgi:hypothetical protein